MSDVDTPRVPRVALVGHCSPDSSFLTMALKRAVPGVLVIRAGDDQQVEREIHAGCDLLLVNRRMEPGYASDDGNDYIRRLRAKFPQARVMLVSNYPDAQAQAVSAGAINGFGKDSLMAPATIDHLRQTLGVTADAG